jgi:hypothetical protein
MFPRGWRPPPDWVPDASWPAAPEGWSWWAVRRRRYLLGLLDRPVFRDWLLYVALFGVLLGRPGIGSADVDWQIDGRPRPGDSIGVKLAVWIGLFVLEVLFFLVIPGLARRYIRHRTFRAAQVPVGYEQSLDTRGPQP